MKRRDSYDELLSRLTTHVIVDTGTGEPIARHYARSLMDFLQQEKAANGMLYVPAPPRQVDVLQVRAALERGDTIRKVCRDHSVSRRALFRLFPGGLPSPTPKSAA